MCPRSPVAARLDSYWSIKDSTINGLHAMRPYSPRPNAKLLIQTLDWAIGNAFVTELLNTGEREASESNDFI